MQDNSGFEPWSFSVKGLVRLVDVARPWFESPNSLFVPLLKFLGGVDCLLSYCHGESLLSP